VRAETTSRLCPREISQRPGWQRHCRHRHTTATRQTLEGIGGALTESSAFVLANVSKEKRNLILDYFFSPRQAQFHHGAHPYRASDFCVKGKYSYDDFPGDVSLEHFSIDPIARASTAPRIPPTRPFP